jgi:stage V sporulation protein AF
MLCKAYPFFVYYEDDRSIITSKNHGRTNMSDTEKTLYTDYAKNVDCLRRMLRAESSFDILERHLAVCSRDMCFFFIDGFIKDAEMQRMMQTLLGLKEPASSRSIELRLPYVEIEREANLDRLVLAVLSGQTVILAESFGAEAIVADLRTYPARDTAEPEGDRVMQGARDGFVETLVQNTALIRRRVRDPALTVSYTSVGSSSRTDIAILYMEGKADSDLVEKVKERNFAPVVDDRGCFIGLITRRDVLSYFARCAEAAVQKEKAL